MGGASEMVAFPATCEDLKFRKNCRAEEVDMPPMLGPAGNLRLPPSALATNIQSSWSYEPFSPDKGLDGAKHVHRP